MLIRTAILGAVFALCFQTVYSQEPIPVRFLEPVVISPAQADLLATEAKFLGERATKATLEVKTIEGKGGPKGDFAVLGKTLSGHTAKEAVAVDQTRARFLELSPSNLHRQAAQVFFDDIRRRYSGLSQDFKKSGYPEFSKFEPATYGKLRDRTFNLLDYNARAYKQVATAKSLTFDLTVRSAPGGAAVEFRREGDPYQKHFEPTNTTVTNLVYALWNVRATLGSSKPQEQTHDPYRATNHVVSFDSSKP
jgi:hypothetical protein